MVWTIPDKSEGQNDIQSILFQEYLDILAAGVQGTDCVLSGCAVTAQGSPDLTVSVASGAVLSNGVRFAVGSGNVTIAEADATNPRLDLIVVNSSGTKTVRSGTAAVAPSPPAKTANDVVLAVVYVPATDTTIATAQIVDLRIVRSDLDDTNGLFKRISGNSGAAGNWKTLQLLTSAASTNSSTTAAAVMTTTGVGAGTWQFKYSVIYQSSATSNGVGFQIGHNGTVTKMVVTSWFTTSGGTAANALADQAGSDTANLVEGKSQRAVGQKMGSSLGVDTQNADMHVTIEGVIVITASGSLTLEHYSEGAVASTVQSGTCLELTKIG
jgi:hypothetical protein